MSNDAFWFSRIETPPLGQKKECCKNDQLMHILFHLVLRTKGEYQGEDEQTNGVFDDVIPQQRGGDDARGQLRAGDLDRHEQGSERKDQEGKRCGDGGLEQSLSTWEGESKKIPSEPTVKPVRQSCDGQFNRNGVSRQGYTATMSPGSPEAWSPATTAPAENTEPG